MFFIDQTINCHDPGQSQQWSCLNVLYNLDNHLYNWGTTGHQLVSAGPEAEIPGAQLLWPVEAAPFFCREHTSKNVVLQMTIRLEEQPCNTWSYFVLKCCLHQLSALAHRHKWINDRTLCNRTPSIEPISDDCPNRATPLGYGYKAKS